MAGRLAGKVALVTGAGSVGPGWGNGRAAAVLFAREGAKVVVVDLDRAAAGETARLIGEEQGRGARARGRRDRSRVGDGHGGQTR